MSMIIWRLKMRRAISYTAITIGFIAFLTLILLLTALTSPPQYRLKNTLGLAVFIIPIMVASLALERLAPRPPEVVFTEDGLIVKGRKSFTVPKDEVVSNNVVCIRKSPTGLMLHVAHGLVEYSLPLSQRQYDELANALGTYWGWEPPECPRVRIEVGPVPEAPGVSAPLTMPGGVLWRLGSRRYYITKALYYIGLGATVYRPLLIIGVIILLLGWSGLLDNLVVIIIAIIIVIVAVVRLLRTVKWTMYSNVREIVLTSDGFTITDRNGNTLFIPRDEALDSICVGGTNPYPSASYIEYILFINYNGVSYRVIVPKGSFDRLQKALSRAWGRSIRGC
ncbi:MAG: hypothetical protein AT718_00155 [Vulcanisaeta sp. JCHS_4]|jgi:hypothetical protein|nr:MAG: hypothetical protein AT718_00155 [Vulcanisaeta sp. JCHS_4]